MAFLDLPINLDDLPQDDGGSFDPIPAGEYIATIEGAELMLTKAKEGRPAGAGQYINLKLKIEAPTHANRVVFGIVNIRNANPEAERIGRTQLGNIQRALGIATLQDTDQLIGGRIAIKVAIKAATEKYPAGNEVKAYKAVDGAAAPKPAASTVPSFAAPAQASAAPAKAAPPWAKK